AAGRGPGPWLLRLGLRPVPGQPGWLRCSVVESAPPSGRARRDTLDAPVHLRRHVFLRGWQPAARHLADSTAGLTGAAVPDLPADVRGPGTWRDSLPPVPAGALVVFNL